MSDMHIYIAIGLPTLTIMIALVINVVQIFGVRRSIREIRSDVKALTGRITES